MNDETTRGGFGATGQRVRELDSFLHLSPDDVARIILWLLVEEAIRSKLSGFRQDLPAEPVEGKEGTCATIDQSTYER